MSDNKYPIGGFAPGTYQCTCADCGQKFQGDRRAVQCEPCAEKGAAYYNSLTPEQKEEHHKKFKEMLKQLFTDNTKGGEGHEK